VTLRYLWLAAPRSRRSGRGGRARRRHAPHFQHIATVSRSGRRAWGQHATSAFHRFAREFRLPGDL